MSVKTATMPLADKLAVVESLIRTFRRGAREGNAVASENYEALKAVATDLQARSAIARGDTLVEMEIALERVLRSKTSLGYDEGQLVQLAATVLRRWPTIKQSLERFEKEQTA